MKKLTPEQRLEIVQIYYKNNSSIRSTFRALRPIFGRHNRPSESAIRSIINQFRTKSTVVNNANPKRRRRVRTDDAIAAVEQSIEDNPNESIRIRAQQLNLSPSTLRKILREDLGSNPYNIQMTQELKPMDVLDLQLKVDDTETKTKVRPIKRESEAVVEPPAKDAICNNDDAAVPSKRVRGRPPKATAKEAAASNKKETSDEEDNKEKESSVGANSS